MTDKHYQFLNLGEVTAPYREQLYEAARRVIDSGRYIGGEEVDALESELAAICCVRHAIGVSNGLDALRLTLKALIIMGRLETGDEIIVPGNTFVATFLAVSDAGLTPVAVDPDLTTQNIDSSAVERHLTGRTRGVIPVHLFGRVAWDGAMKDVIRRNNLIVVEDAAQSIGAISASVGLNSTRQAGSLGHAGALSFYPTKNIGALGDAGAVTTNDTELAETIRALANYGSDRRNHYLYKGYNARLDPVQAAMLRVRLPYIKQENADRFARAVAYSNTIRHPDVELPLMSRHVTDCVWHQYVIRTSRRDELRDYLLHRGVETDVHYPVPPHRQPCFKDLPHGPLPITERLAEEMISLPISACTSVKDASDIGRIINEF